MWLLNVDIMHRMSSFLKISLIFLSVIFLHLDVSAVGAYPFLQKVTQPDGTSLNIRMNGDEWFNWVSTSDGYRIVRNDAGVFEYVSILKSGEIRPSGVRASDPERRTTDEMEYIERIAPGPGVSHQVINEARSLFVSPLLKNTNNLFPSSGQRKLLVILANFSDTQPSFSQADFERYMNEENYNGTGSFRDYYLENSGGKLDVTSVVTQWVTLPNPRAYYGPREKWGEFAYHAVQAAAAAGVDFSQFDNTGNGVVEGVAIIHHGPGQEVTSDETDIWSHAWALSAAGYSQSQRRFNGVLVDRYTAQPETRTRNGVMNTIGVIAHEFGHNLGAPDYYDTNGDEDGRHDGTGRWDIMASGNYNGSPSGSAPAHHNPFTKNELGWVEQIEISTPALQTLKPVIASAKVLKVKSPVEHEYYLLENRRRVGFDRALPGQGMIVYHVDANRIASRRAANNINSQAHQGLMVKPASGIVNSASAPFPGTMLVTQFTDETTPAMRTWTGESFNRSITGITLVDEDVVFDFMAVQNGSPIVFTAQTTGASEIELAWTPSLQNYPVLIAWSPDGVFGNPVAGQLYGTEDQISGGGKVLYYGDELLGFVHGQLESATRYYYRIWSDVGGDWSGALSANAKTDLSEVTSFPWSDGFEDGLSNWVQTYLLSVVDWEAKEFGTANKPEQAYSGSAFAGFFAESFSGAVTRLESPLLMLSQESSYVLDFRHIQPAWNGDQDELSVLVKRESATEWEVLALYTDDETEWMARRIAIPYSEPVRLAFQGRSRYGYGIGIDDVKVYEANHCFAQTPQVTSFEVVEKGFDFMRIRWSLADELPVLVAVRQGKKVTELPTPGQSYSANSIFPQGQQLGNDAFVVFSGSGDELLLTGLSHSTEYHVAVFPYSETYCYAFEPQMFVASTNFRIHDITFVVTSDGLPVSGASISVDGEIFTTDADGRIVWQRLHDENYLSFSAVSTGYRRFWGRLIPDGNKSVLINLELLQPKHVTGMSHSANYSEVSLSWNPVIDEDFDGYKAFSLSLPGWTMLDKDKGRTWAINNHTFPEQGYTGAFILFDPLHESMLQADFDITAYSGRHLLAGFASRNAPNDDWLISPQFEVMDGDGFSFMARSLSSTYGLETFQVLVSEQGSTPDNFVLLSASAEIVPVQWTQYSYSLASFVGKKVKVAIRHTSDDVFVLLLDRINVGAIAAVPSGVSITPDFTLPQNSNLLRKAEVVQMDKKSTQKFISGSDAAPKGGIGYELEQIGGNTIAFNGFADNVHGFIPDDCDTYSFRTRVVYNNFGVTSDWSPVYSLIPCYEVSFLVISGDNKPVSGALVEFNQDAQYTDGEGVAVFNSVRGANGLIYNVLLQGNEIFSGTVDVNGSKQVLVSLLTVQKDSVSQHNIEVYPMPFIDRLNIAGVDTDEEVFVTVFDVGGRMVFQKRQAAVPEISINTSGFAPGIYVIEVRTEKLVKRLKGMKR